MESEAQKYQEFPQCHRTSKCESQDSNQEGHCAPLPHIYLSKHKQFK